MAAANTLSAHNSNLGGALAWTDELRNPLNQQSPYMDFDHLMSTTDFKEINFNEALYGVGLTLSNFPSIHDVFSTNMQNIDVSEVYDDSLSQVANTDTIRALSDAHRDTLDDDLEQNILPRFKAGMRDMNSVMSSTFIVGAAIIEQGKIKALADYDAKIQYNLINSAMTIFAAKLNWHQNIVNMYLNILRASVDIELNTAGFNYEILAKGQLWPFTVIEHCEAIVASLGSQTVQTGTSGDGASVARGAIGGSMTGAAAGFLIGGPPGAVVGGVLGGLSGLLG